MDKEGMEKRLRSKRRTLRKLIERASYCASPGVKEGIYMHTDGIKNMVVEEVEGNGEEDEDYNLSEFGMAYSELVSTLASAKALPESSTRNEIKESFKRFHQAIIYIELTLKGVEVEDWNVTGDGEGGEAVDPDELVEMML